MLRFLEGIYLLGYEMVQPTMQEPLLDHKEIPVQHELLEINDLKAYRESSDLFEQHEQLEDNDLKVNPDKTEIMELIDKMALV